MAICLRGHEYGGTHVARLRRNAFPNFRTCCSDGQPDFFLFLDAPEQVHVAHNRAPLPVVGFG